MRAIAWSRSESERYWGPFTWSPRSSEYRCWTIALRSHDDESPGYLRLAAAGHTLLVRVPDWLLRPHREKIHVKDWDAATVARLGRDWYWQVDEREYGLSFVDRVLHVHYGRQTHDSRTDHSRCFFMPWDQWRSVRHSYYDRYGYHTHDGLSNWRFYDYDEWKRLQDIAETVKFAFLDFDGELLTAELRLEERESARGVGRWRWLSRLSANRVSRSFDIQFSGETGSRKGSWKGGTVGHSIVAANPEELHEMAFRRYCAEHDMTFLHEVVA